MKGFQVPGHPQRMDMEWFVVIDTGEGHIEECRVELWWPDGVGVVAGYNLHEEWRMGELDEDGLGFYKIPASAVLWLLDEKEYGARVDIREADEQLMRYAR